MKDLKFVLKNNVDLIYCVLHLKYLISMLLKNQQVSNYWNKPIIFMEM